MQIIVKIFLKDTEYFERVKEKKGGVTKIVFIK